MCAIHVIFSINKYVKLLACFIIVVEYFLFIFYLVTYLSFNFKINNICFIHFMGARSSVPGLILERFLTDNIYIQSKIR